MPGLATKTTTCSGYLRQVNIPFYALYCSIMTSKCPERKVLADAVAAAVQAVYRAKRAYDSAKMKNSENVEEIGVFLAAARKTEIEATTALQEHVNRCSSMKASSASSCTIPRWKRSRSSSEMCSLP